MKHLILDLGPDETYLAFRAALNTGAPDPKWLDYTPGERVSETLTEGLWKAGYSIPERDPTIDDPRGSWDWLCAKGGLRVWFYLEPTLYTRLLHIEVDRSYSAASWATLAEGLNTLEAEVLKLLASIDTEVKAFTRFDGSPPPEAPRPKRKRGWIPTNMASRLDPDYYSKFEL